MRRFSRRMSGGSSKKSKNSSVDEKKAVSLYDRPVPAQRQMTTGNLFQQTAATAEQSTAMDRTLYEIPQPQAVDAMTDLIKDHQQGEFFPYVGVVGSEGESSDARRARMLALKPSYNKRDVPEIKVLGCPLISREGNFSMSTLMEFATANFEPIPEVSAPVPQGAHTPNYKITKPYVHIRQVTILFTPNVSSTSNYCRFWMNLIDNRLIDSEKGSQTNVVVSNQEGILELSCDYCVSRVDLAAFTLSYTMERDIVHPGFQWGTCSFYFSITESDLPYQSSKVDAMAVYRMPITTLMDRKTNADKSDISFTPADLVKLRKLYQTGDIVDVDEPQTARLKTNTYSKSSIRAKPKGKEIDVSNKPGWEFMQGARAQKVDAAIASVDPESDDEEVDLPEVDVEAASRERKATLERYKAQQELERIQRVNEESMKMIHEVNDLIESSEDEKRLVEIKDDQKDDLDAFFKPAQKKRVQFGASGV